VDALLDGLRMPGVSAGTRVPSVLPVTRWCPGGRGCWRRLTRTLHLPPTEPAGSAAEPLHCGPGLGVRRQAVLLSPLALPCREPVRRVALDYSLT